MTGPLIVGVFAALAMSGSVGAFFSLFPSLRALAMR